MEVLLIIMIIAAYLDNSVPYFPIEISRIASSGHYGYYGLCIGAIYMFQYTPNWITWIGLLILTIIDDKMNWTIHMLGVLIMLCGVVQTVYHDIHKLLGIFCIGIIFAMRIIVRNIAIYAIEQPNVSDLIKRNVEIMYNGNCHPIILTIFKLSGILQWVCFWAIFQILIKGLKK